MSEDKVVTAAQNLVQPDTPAMYEAVNAVASDVAELKASGASFDDVLQHFGLAGEQARGDESAIKAYFRELSAAYEAEGLTKMTMTDEEIADALRIARDHGSCHAGPDYDIVTYDGDGIYSVRADDTE